MNSHELQVQVKKRPDENIDELKNIQRKNPEQGYKIKKKVKNYSIYAFILGKGSYGTALLAQKDGDDKLMACKIIERKVIISNPKIVNKFKERLQAEIDTWRQLNHPNIVKFYDYAESVNNLYMFMEYCPKKTLEQRLKPPVMKLQESEAMGLFLQMAAGCLYLFEKNIVHRDLKPSNILFAEDGTLKIADFGFAKYLDSEKKEEQHENTGQIGTIVYMSPQVYEGKPYSIKTDVWSLGVIFYEVLIGKTPDYFLFNLHNSVAIVDSTDIFFPPNNVKIRQEIKDLIKAMLVKEEEKRIGITEVYQKLNQIVKQSQIDQENIVKNSKNDQ